MADAPIVADTAGRRMVGSHIRTLPLNAWAKTDNRHLGAKLGLRRYFLQKYPPKKVIDCCAGEQVIWTALRGEFPDIEYMGLDKNRVGNGIVKIAAERWLSQVEWDADVVDIDSYGEPWPIYNAALENFVGGDLTVFLTACNTPMKTVRIMSGPVRESLGIPKDWKIWHSKGLADMATRACMAYALKCGFEVVEAQKVVLPDNPLSSWLYFYAGLRLRWT